MRSLSWVACAATLGALGACQRPPVAWGEATLLDRAAVAAAGPRWTIAFGARGAVMAVAPTPTPRPEARHACPRSLAAARTSGVEWFAGWWVARADSSVALMVSRSVDGGATWSPALVADARDQGRRGCDRPPPAIAGDSATGYVHLAYFLEPQEGAGVWLIHSMEHGAMWHSPVAIAFGADPALASVAAQGDTVAVAHESPNANEGWIGLALSTSDGHLIDWRIPEVSGRSVPARDPRVALRGRDIAIAWSTRRGGLAMARAGVRQ